MLSRSGGIKLLVLIWSVLAATEVHARFTEYYSMYQASGRVNPRECRMEGTQVMPDGQLIDYQCKKVKEYCPWGLGARGCVVPCATAACTSSMARNHTRISTNFICPWGPLKGQRIKSVECNDVGGMIGSGHYDLFMGICKRKNKGDKCIEYVNDDYLASYGKGKGKEAQIAMDLIMKKADDRVKDATQLAAFYGGSSSQVASADSSFAPSANAESGEKVVVATKSDCLNVRKLPSSRNNSSVQTCLDPGTPLKVLEPGRYALVELADGSKGYVFSKYLSGSLEGKPDVADLVATGGKPNAPMCSASQPVDPYAAVRTLLDRGIVPLGSSRRQMYAEVDNWPTLANRNGKMVVTFGGSKSMCTSFSMTAVLQQIADRVNAGQLSLTDRQISFLNSEAVLWSFNGNTNSAVPLYKSVGGSCIRGGHKSNFSVSGALKKAHPGDLVKYDHDSGGHSTIFQALRSGSVCFASSQRGTHGPGETCRRITRLNQVVICRLPEDGKTLADGIDRLMSNRELVRLMSSPSTMNKYQKVIRLASYDKELPGCDNRQVALASNRATGEKSAK